MPSSLTSARMSRLIPAASDRPSDDPIFALNAEAQRRAAEGEAVINATLGALMENDGSLAVMPAVFEAYSKVDPQRAAAYAPIAGDVPFLNAVMDDVFGSSPMRARAEAVATAGGTGALHHAIVNFLEPGEELCTTNWYWSPYNIIAHHTGRGVRTFQMFDDSGSFDIGAFEACLRDQVARQSRALVIFNFPCHNPTGYSLDDGEWAAMAEVMNSVGKEAPVAFVLDLAYARYGASGKGHWTQFLEAMSHNCTLLVAWSASKAYAQYGSRVGSLIVVPPTEEERAPMRNALAYSCRGTWSNCNHLGILAITELLTDSDLKARSDEERGRLRELLDERVNAFNRAAEKETFKYPRYEGGFFVSVFVSDAPKVAEVAREEGVFVVPMKDAVRIALCSTATQDVPRLVEVLGRAIVQVEN